ncbi:hypothetical protein [Streptomyces sp. NPDC048172]|uniref:hypothetical protein n=1 Tax=Streptomyces sp. NPDC048172 TaxID=3365505 RepID=UPI0037192CB7
MDREYEFQQMFHPRSVGVRPDPGRCLMMRRRANLRQQLAMLRAKGRMPRVCLYALTTNPEAQPPARSLEEARAFAVREGWQVGAEQIYIDHTGPTHPELRPGWAAVQRQFQSGFADGVVALTQAAITPHHDEYDQQLRWCADRYVFIALVHPESAAVRP